MNSQFMRKEPRKVSDDDQMMPVEATSSSEIPRLSADAEDVTDPDVPDGPEFDGHEGWIARLRFAFAKVLGNRLGKQHTEIRMATTCTGTGAASMALEACSC